MATKQLEPPPLDEVISKLARLIKQAQPLAQRLASEESFADDRAKLRALTDGFPAGGSYLFRLQTISAVSVVKRPGDLPRQTWRSGKVKSEDWLAFRMIQLGRSTESFRPDMNKIRALHKKTTPDLGSLVTMVDQVATLHSHTLIQFEAAF